jgi:hypothetical protein
MRDQSYGSSAQTTKLRARKPKNSKQKRKISQSNVSPPPQKKIEKLMQAI